MANLYKTLLKEAVARNILMENATKARDWLSNTSRNVRVNPNTVINQAKQEDTATIGKMFLFAYEPKHAKTLPYYDRFPLIFPFALDSSGFYGINMHYLPHTYRAVLMDGLYDITSAEQYNANTKVKLSYNILKSSSKLRYFRPCVKRYLNTHVRSPLALIPADQWNLALFLPLERFVKATQEQVFADSRKQLRNR